MLQSFRDNLKGGVAIILVGLICIPFAIFGIDSLFSQSSVVPEVAEVNGKSITQYELDQALQLQKRQLVQQFGENLPPDFLSDDRLRQPVLESLVQRKALLQAAEKSGLTASEKQLNEIILASPEYQVNGKFDTLRFQQVLRGAGYTVATYKGLLTDEVVLNQYATTVGQSNFALDSEVKALTKLGLQTRDFDFVTLDINTVLPTIEVSDAEIDEYYQSHQDRYLEPESVVIEAVEINTDDFLANIEVSEEALKQEYDAEVKNYQATTERRASHILLDDSADDYQETLESIQSRLASGEDFAALAKEFSQDFGSKDSGGDVGYTSGSTFVEPFETALANLSVGEISEPVESQFGVHIIKLTDVQEKAAPTFDELRFELAQRIKTSEAETVFVQKSELLADIAYNVNDLKPVADELGVELWTSARFNRQTPAGLAVNPEVLDQAFDEDLIASGRTSDIISLGDNRSVVIRVIEHTPESVKSLEQVKEQVAESVKADKAQQRLLEVADELLASAKGTSFSEAVSNQTLLEGVELTLTQAREVSRQQTEFPSDLVSEIFSYSKSDAENAAFSKVELASGGVALVQFLEVKEGDLTKVSEQELNAVNAQLAQAYGNADISNVRKVIVDESDVEYR